MIKFITEDDDNKIPTFGDVEINQFFVDAEGFLCQKVWDCQTACIANPDGDPWAVSAYGTESSEEITSILPRVTKIEF